MDRANNDAITKHLVRNAVHTSKTSTQTTAAAARGAELMPHWANRANMFAEGALPAHFREHKLSERQLVLRTEDEHSKWPRLKPNQGRCVIAGALPSMLSASADDTQDIGNGTNQARLDIHEAVGKPLCSRNGESLGDFAMMCADVNTCCLLQCQKHN